MAAILRVRDADGNVVEIPAIQGDQGVGIQNIERTAGNGAPGTDDTYTITMTNGKTYFFTVHNGTDGTGAGDMLQATYDPQGKAQDIFGYVDNKLAALPTPDVSGQINTHNTSSSAHSDIRTAVRNAAAAANSKMATDFSNASAILGVANGGTGVSSLADLENAFGGAKIQTFSYSGTGKSGSSNPNSITFGFAPKCVMLLRYRESGHEYWYDIPTEIANNNTKGSWIMLLENMTTTFKEDCGFGTNGYAAKTGYYGKKSADGKTISWYSAAGVENQFNVSGNTYCGIAFG